MPEAVPVVATEIEFYLYGSERRDMEVFWQVLREACEKNAIGIYKIEKERGREQHEIALRYTRDIEKIIRDSNRLKQLLAELAGRHGLEVDFSAKPLEAEPGSGLHIHVHLEDESGKNLFTKDGDEMSDALAHSIAGLLAKLPEDLPHFVSEAGKARLVAGSNAPTTISWGANNRTVAVRLPDKGTKERHIEHRVAGADVEVEEAVRAVLAAISFGMEHKLTPPPQIYGDAGLPMYGLQTLLPE